MENYLIFNGKSSADYGVWISGGGTFNAPSRDIDTEIIPGRNGALIFDNGRYNNITVVYPGFISRDFSSRVGAFRAYMAAQVGYKRLEDTYHPNEFRLASFRNGLEVSTAVRNMGGTFNIEFDCKPQRFLKSGERSTAYASGAKINNETNFDALPIIQASGNGSITLNGTTITISGNSGVIYIDCDTQDAYNGSTNKNRFITPNFPKLSPGLNTLTYTGVTGVRITPRWWTL